MDNYVARFGVSKEWLESHGISNGPVLGMTAHAFDIRDMPLGEAGSNIMNRKANNGYCATASVPEVSHMCSAIMGDDETRDLISRRLQFRSAAGGFQASLS